MLKCLSPSSSTITAPQVLVNKWLHRPTITHTDHCQISLISPIYPAGLPVYSKNLSTITQSFFWEEEWGKGITDLISFKEVLLLSGLHNTILKKVTDITLARK